MAIAGNRIEIWPNRRNSTAGIVLFANNVRTDAFSWADDNSTQGQFHYGTNADAADIRTAQTNGTPVFLKNGIPYYAFDPDDEDSVGLPVINPIEPWMWDYWPFDPPDVREARRVSRVTPGLGQTRTIPHNSISQTAESDDNGAYNQIKVSVTSDWKIYLRNQLVEIKRLDINLRDGLLTVFETVNVAGTGLEGYTIELRQGTTTVEGVLNQNNQLSRTALTSLVATSDITITVTFRETLSTGVVGTVGVVRNATTKPSAPVVPAGAGSTDFKWDSTQDRLVNLPTGWYRLDDTARPALAANEIEWVSWSWVGANSALGDFSDPVYMGGDVVQYTTDTTVTSSTTWTTTKPTNPGMMRVYSSGAWSAPVPIAPKASLAWNTIATIDKALNSAATASYRVAVTGADISFDGLTEMMIRWSRRNSGGDVEFTRTTKPIPILDILSDLRNYTATALDHEFQGQAVLVMMGWTDGRWSDVLPNHNNINLGTVNDSNFDVAFFIMFNRPIGASVTDNRIGYVTLLKTTAASESALIDIMVR